MNRADVARRLSLPVLGLVFLLTVVTLLPAEEPPCTAPPCSPAYNCPPIAGCATDFSEFAGTWSANCWGCCGRVAAGKIFVENAKGNLEFQYTGMSWGGIPSPFAAPASTYAGKIATTVRSASVVEKTQVRDGGFENYVQIASSDGPGNLVLTGKITTTMTIEKHFDASFASTTFSTDGPVTFVRADGKRPLRIGATQALDALARVHACDVKYTKVADGYEFETSLPASWLADAAWPVIIDPLIGSPESVTEESALDDDFATASFGGRYFVAWRSEPVGGGNDDIYGRILAADGSVFGPTFAIATGTRQQRFPKAAHVPAGSGVIGLAHKEGDRAVLRRFDLSGTLTGRSALNDLGLTDEVGEIAIASDGIGNFLIAWIGWPTGSSARQLWAEIRTSSGALVKGDTLIATATGTIRLDKPEVVWNSTLGEWFFAWHGFDSATPGSPRVAEGIAWNTGLTATTLPRFALTTTPTSNRDPDVAWNSAANEYLAVWENDPGPGLVVKGRRIHADTGAFLGAEFNVEAVAGSSRNPEVLWNPVAGRWLAVFEKSIGGERGTFGQAIAADGTLLGTPFTLSDDVGVSEENPTLARNNTDDEFLALWTDSGIASRDIWIVRLETTPPAPPSGLTASNDADSITLTWMLGTEPDLTSYLVFRSTTSGGPHTLIASFPAPATGPVSHDDATVLSDTTYYYVLRAVDVRGNISDASAEVSESLDTTPPAAPTALSATPGDTTVSLTWAPNTEADLAGYNAYYRAVGSAIWIKANLVVVVSTAFTVTGLTNGVTYEFAVSAVDDSGNESALSAVVTATPVAPGVSPSGFTAIGLNRKISLTWDAATDPDVIGFYVYEQQAPGCPFERITSSPVVGTSYLVTALTNGNTYSYKLTFVFSDLTESDPAGPVSAVPRYPTPTGLTLDEVIDGEVTLSWDPLLIEDLAGYHLYFSGISGGPYGFATSELLVDSEITLSGVGEGTWYFVVTAVSLTFEESDFSTEVLVVVSESGAAPPILAASNERKTNDTTPVLRGTAPAGFMVKLYESGEVIAVGFAGPTGYFEISVESPLPEGEYSIAATAQEDEDGPESPFSASVDVTIDVTPPATPSGLSVMGNDNFVLVRWDQNEEIDLRGYDVHRRLSAPGSPWVKQNDKPLLLPRYVDRSVTTGETYEYKVEALDDAKDED